MATFSAQELLQRHGIDFVSTKSGKFTTNCPKCGTGYLNVKIEKEKVVWYCHHCDDGASERYEQKEGVSDLGKPVAVYDYEDEGGKRLYQVMRFEPPGQPKQFRQRTGPDQEKWSIKGVRIVPFRLPELMADLAAERTVFVVEGEKDVIALRQHNVPATCNPMGAGKWWDSFNEILKGADVVICGDNDNPGREHVRLVAKHLLGIAGRLRVLDLRNFWNTIEESNDIGDWLVNHDVERLWQIVGDLPDYKLPEGNGHDKSGVPELPKITPQKQFLEDFKPPDYLIQAILQRRFIYALTGQTGHAKTAVALLLARLISCADQNVTLGKYRVGKGRVIYFVGENPDDVRMRLIGANAERTDAPEKDNLWFIPKQFVINDMMQALRDDIKKNGEFVLVIIDTSAAYFLGDDEISNTQMGNYARMLRTLTTLPGGPCVLVLCHPIKYVVDATQLLPRGGGAYLAEMDGNLTLWRVEDDLVQLHHNKMRGTGFQPITFKLKQIRNVKLADTSGRIIPTVQAVPISQTEEEATVDRAENEEDRVLAVMLNDADGSLTTWAMQLDWYLEETKEPYKMKVSRILEKLGTTKPALAKKVRGNRWQLTDEGKVVARKASLKFRDEAERNSQDTMF